MQEKNKRKTKVQDDECLVHVQKCGGCTNARDEKEVHQRRTYSGVDVAIPRNKGLGAPRQSVDVLAIMRHLHSAIVVEVGAVHHGDLVR